MDEQQRVSRYARDMVHAHYKNVYKVISDCEGTIRESRDL